jgi:hypothetical protein
MARVFISYRRADGQYAVGWIEERLRQISGDDGVTTAFRDSDLRYGDDFPDRLAHEVDECDVLIAVIGTRWRGSDDGEPARILDPADWVGREITSALADPGKLIVPVLLSGVEPLRASDLNPEHRRFADLHALRFDVREDLEELAEQVEQHLLAIDEERNRRIGLDTPLPSPTWRPTSRSIAAAALAAVVGGAIAWLLKALTDSSNLSWVWFSTVQVAYWSGACVIGVAYVRGVLADALEVHWKAAVRAGAIALVLIGMTITSYAPGDDQQVAVTFLEAVAALLLLSPWILAMIGAGWYQTTDSALRSRALVLLKQRRALSVATGVLVVALALSVCTSSALVTDPDPGAAAAFSIIGFGVFLSIVVIGGVEYGHSGLRRESDLLDREMADLGATARSHVEPALARDRAELWPRVALLAAVPTLVAVVASLVVFNTPPPVVILSGRVLS